MLEAWDRLGSRRVALKVPIEPFAGDEAFLDRLQREVSAVAGFAHANVAAVHAMERAGPAALVVVELVDGSNLRDMLEERGPMPPAGAARVTAGVCAAVAAANARGITHGHLIAANVLLTIDGRVKVTDFRLAQAALAAGGVADHAGDVRALGRCLAAMLTGREHAGAEAVRLGPPVPAELAAIVARAACAGERHAVTYRSAAELGQDLAGFLAAARPGAGGPARLRVLGGRRPGAGRQVAGPPGRRRRRAHNRRAGRRRRPAGVPNVVGLHREQAADVLAKAQLGVEIQEVPVPQSGKAQRVIDQQPAASQVVPARSEVVVLVATRRPTG